MARRLILPCALTIALAAACGDGSKPAPSAGGVRPEDAARLAELQNRGIACLERYDYGEAEKALREAHALAPTWIPARHHLALALIHATQGSSSEARKLVDGILAEQPEHPHAAFLAAWLAERNGETERSAKLYETAWRVSGKDPIVGAKYGILLAGIDGREKDALAVLAEVHAARPALVAAVNQLMLLHRMTGDEATAKRYFDTLIALKGPLRADMEQPKVGEEIREAYGNFGPLSMAVRSFPLPGAGRIQPAKPLRAAEGRPVAKTGVARFSPVRSFAAFDADGDGDTDVVGTFGQGPDDAALPGLLRNDGGALVPASLPLKDGSSLAIVAGAFAVGDFDIDPSRSEKQGAPGRRARPDLVVALRSQAPQVYRNLGGGTFEAVPAAETGLADPNLAIRWIGAFDLDQDGDLDLLASTDTGLRVWSNSGAARFTDVTESCGLGAEKAACGPAVAIDFDRDYDLDLVVSRPGAAPLVFANERLMKFRAVAAPAAAGPSPFGVIAGDFDSDGTEDCVLFGDASATLLRGAGRALAAQAVPGSPGGAAVAVDLDNRGVRDLVFADGTVMRGTLDPQQPFAPPAERGALDATAHIVALDADGDGAEDVLRLPGAGDAALLDIPGRGKGRSVVLDLEGVIRNDVQAGWSNLEGRGALVEVKSGAVWQQFRAGNVQGNGGATGNRIVAGIGDAKQADFVRVLWPDAVQHAILDVPVGSPQPVVEEQRRPDSCPLLFSWDGEKWAFVTDFLGVGGVGFLVAPGVYGPPDPTESVKVEAPLVRAKDGQYVFRVMEAMEEVCYVDHADLEVVDHPRGTTVFPDERFAGEPPFPDGTLLPYRDEILPVAAKDQRGDDVTERITAIDRRYPDSFRLHPRLLGATEEQVLELDFGDRLAGIAPGDPVALFLHGWIEYGYTRTSVAAAGEGFAYQAPALEAFDAATGAWKPLVPNLGYPAGFPRVMTHVLTGLVSRDTPRLRIRTNFEVYVDRVWLGRLDRTADVRRTIVPCRSADLRWAGYPREFSPDGRFPRIYDYQTMDPSAPWKTVEGDYTRFGEVSPLLATADDMYVIFGKGEEIELRFDAAALPPLAEGFERSFVLRFTGWCKGQELYTAHGWTVEPLPFLGMSHYPYGPDERFPDGEAHRRWRREWNTRKVR
ncbi:MAG: hypothetical protein HMLKMBBP_02626 [Planctomycetes bacterium]|nr:hypothetical protein [Planctomycetota bacterium]